MSLESKGDPAARSPFERTSVVSIDGYGLPTFLLFYTQSEETITEARAYSRAHCSGIPASDAKPTRIRLESDAAPSARPLTSNPAAGGRRRTCGSRPRVGPRRGRPAPRGRRGLPGPCGG